MSHDERSRGSQGGAEVRAPVIPNDPLVGTPYQTMGPLGAGAMGLVLDARQRSTGKPVVVKVLHAHLVGQTDLVDRMHLEARSLAALDGHPNVVAVIDAGETCDGRPYFAMERLLGRTLLAERKRAGKLAPAQAIDFACQVLAGLAAAHAAGIVHRDIKPANLFVCDAPPGGRRLLKVLDFGVAKLVQGSHPGEGAPAPVVPRALATEANAVVGTIAYLAPEQAIGAEVDARTDLYALGAVLFSLLTGRTPFEHHTTQMDMLRAHLTEAPRPPSELAGPHIPSALDRAVLRALAKAPDDRFPNARAFAAELSRIAAELPRVAAELAPSRLAAPSFALPIAPEAPRRPSPERRLPARVDPVALGAVWLVSMAATIAGGLVLAEVIR